MKFFFRIICSVLAIAGFVFYLGWLGKGYNIRISIELQDENKFATFQTSSPTTTTTSTKATTMTKPPPPTTTKKAEKKCKEPSVNQTLHKSILQSDMTSLESLLPTKSNSSIRLLILMPSLIHSQADRTRVRNMWAHKNESEAIKNGTARVVFVVGDSHGDGREKQQKTLSNEAETHGDILQLRVPDSGVNVYKLEAAYRWASSSPNAPMAEHIMKAEKEVVIHVDRFLEQVKMLKNANTTSLFCDVRVEESVIRNPCSEWYVSPADFKNETYPRYCRGITYFGTRAAFKMIVENSAKQNPIVNEDAFFTGLVAETAGVPRINARQIITPTYSEKSGCDGWGRPTMAVLSTIFQKPKQDYAAAWNVLKKAECKCKPIKLDQEEHLRLLEESLDKLVVIAPAESPKPIKILVLLLSTAHKPEERERVRRQWANASMSTAIESGDARAVFVVGTKDEAVKKNLTEENTLYGDILQVAVEEAYHHLVFKLDVAFRWSTSSMAPQTEFILKLDSDTLMHVDRFIVQLDSIPDAKNETLLWCDLRQGVPVLRNVCSKWYVSPYNYGNSTYPKYCLGSAYFGRRKAFSMITEGAKNSSIFVNEDAFFSGVSAHAAGVDRINLKPVIASTFTNVSACDADGRPFMSILGLIFMKPKHDFDRAWEILQNPPCKCKPKDLDQAYFNSLLEAPVKNLTLFTPKLKKQLRLLVLVLSPLEQVAERLAVRDLWANSNESTAIKSGKAKVVFIIGRNALGEEKEKEIQDEQKKFGDLLQVDIAEGYENLVFKLVSAFRWASDPSQVNTDLVLKVNMESVVHVDRIIEHFNNGTRENAIYCDVQEKGSEVIRDPCSKWFVTKTAMATDTYPDYCRGMGYLTSTKTIKEIVEGRKKRMPFANEDAFFTGIVASDAGIDRIQSNEMISAYFTESSTCDALGNPYLSIMGILVEGKPKIELNRIWKILKQPPCTKKRK